MGNEVKRMNFYNELFLTEDEFKVEQNYHIRMRRLHNRYLHTWGIVDADSLKIEKKWTDTTDTAGPTSIVTVTTGMALNRVKEKIEINSSDSWEEDISKEIVLTNKVDLDFSKPINGVSYTATDIVYIYLSNKDLPKSGDKTKYISEEEAVVCLATDKSKIIEPKNIMLGRIILKAKSTTDGTVIIDKVDYNEDILLSEMPLRTYAGFSGSSLSVEGYAGIGTAPIPKYGRLLIEDSIVPLAFREKGIALADGGLWRMPLDNGTLRFDVNTGTAGGEFGTGKYITPLTMTKDGKVGILTTPADALDVNGDLRVRGGNIKDSAGVQRISMLAAGNLDLKDAGGTSRITIADNGNLELKEDGGNAALTIDIAGKVGILTIPSDSLDINGDLRVRGGNIKDSAGVQRISMPPAGNLDLKDAGGTSRITIMDNGNLELKEDGGTAALTVDTAGNVGILTVPLDTLDVNGDLRIRGGDIKDSAGNLRISLPASGNLDLKDAGGTSRITIADNGNLELKEDGGTAALTVDTAGKVGILTAPSDTLDINGDLRVRGGNIKDLDGVQRISIPANGNLDLKDAGGKSRITIADYGRVGIGTKSELSQLTVKEDNIGYNQSGTLATTAGSNAITGTGTSFMSKVAIGDWLWAISPSYSAAKYVTAIASDTALTVDSPFTQTYSGYTWYIFHGLMRVESPWKQEFFISPQGHVGIGTRDTGNDLLDVRGRCYSSGGWQTTNADYAEYFESADSATIPVATPVVLTKEGTVRAAKKGEVPIGIATENSAVVGNSYKEWPQKYLRDKYGRLIMEKVKEEMKLPKKEKITKERQKVKKEEVTEEVVHPEIVQEKGKYIKKEKVEKITREVEVPLFEEVNLYDATGKKIIGKHRVPIMETYEEEVDVLDENGLPVLIGSEEFVTIERPKLNPEYDETKKYIPRSERPEWSCIGLLGQLPLCKGKPVAPTWIKIKDLSDDVELWLVK